MLATAGHLFHRKEYGELSTVEVSNPQSGSHPNIYVRGFPLTWGEAEVVGLFKQFGQLSSLRLVRHSVTKDSFG
jgi:hypothetical protein